LEKASRFTCYLVHKGRDLLKAVEVGDFDTVIHLLQTQVFLQLFMSKLLLHICIC